MDQLKLEKKCILKKKFPILIFFNLSLGQYRKVTLTASRADMMVDKTMPAVIIITDTYLDVV